VPLPEVVIDRLPLQKCLHCKPAGQHPLRRISLHSASRFDQVEKPVQDVAAQVVLAASVGIEKRFDLLPLGVRQVGAVAFTLHRFGVVFGE
jgi:hypothetical protein